jgi:hypothetical protein
MDHDVFSDTWVATDGLGRELPGFDTCGPPRPDRHVGIFYFINRLYDGPEPPADVTKLIAANPENPDFRPDVMHHWGEPEFGYYRSNDRWVLRKHAYMLADAGVDTLIFDTTNDVTFPETYLPLCEVFGQIRAEGERTPDICFLASEDSIHQVWRDLYEPGLHRDLWFHWKGKPLLLFGQWEKRGDMNAVRLPQHIVDFFTIRWSWAWDSLPWYGQDGYHRWPWVAHYPQCVGWDEPGVAEQVPVAVAQHPLAAIGRSFHDGHQPASDVTDTTPYTAQGLHFAEQWQHALSVDPQFIFITGWNEWGAGAQICKDPSQEALMRKWDFFPGAVLSRAGRLLRKGDLYFVDQYNQEFSRDAEPMRGGHTDNYYYQIVAGIRRYKGVRRPEPTSPPRTIDVDGSFDQWDGVTPEYRDHRYDTLHRDEPGWGSAGPYVDTSGRNEFVLLKVVHDDSMLYFYARTRDAITPCTDPNWMLLFINANGSHASGWHGYDYLVNWPALDDRRTTVKASTGGWAWEPAGEVRYRVAGNELMIALPRALVGLAGRPLSLDFHWGDNIPCSGQIEDFFLHGDSAPPRRFDYRYCE